MSDSGAATAAEVVGGEVNGKVELEPFAASVSASEGAPKCKKKKKRKQQEADMKEMGTAQQEEDTGTAAVSALEETPKCKKKKKRKEQEADVKERGAAQQEEAADTAAVSASEGAPKSKKKKEAKAKEKEMAEQEAITAAVSALEGAPKSKKKKEAKAKEREMAEQEATTAAVLALEGAPKSKKKKEAKAKEREMVEQEVTTAAVLASEGTLKCMKRKKEKAKETGMDELEPSAAISASEGAQNCKNKDRGNEMGLAKPEAAAVSESEGTPKCKKKLKKKNKMQEHQESPQALLDHVAADKIVANEPGNGCTKGEGEVGNADVSMDPINGEDPNCSVVKDSDEKVNCKAGEGNKNCNSSLQESCVDRKRLRKRPKRKRKQGSSSRGPGISSQDGDRVVMQSLYSSTDHDLSCICAPCLVQAHKEKVKNIYSPRGSLIRFERKKLLILDLNGLLADINMDYQNAHMAHAKVKAKLVFKRPYCNDFLRFCFQNFELGIWSSRNKDNVNSVVNILMRDLKQYLLFCWDMSNCTVTGCNTVDNKHKPLVLKELKKLWNKEDPNLPWEQGEFSPSNTLLVDDSPYKALCNPPHTAIFPQPYSYLNQREDYSLGPGGDLRTYLERLAAADDVQTFVRDNPFGQPSITESDPHWNFYAQIADKVQKPLA